MRTHRFGIAIAAALALNACQKGAEDAGGSAGGKAGKGGKAMAFTIPVQVGKVRRGDVVATAEFIGNLKARHRVRLGAETAGLVVEADAREGDPFAEGDLLVKLNDRDQKIVLAQVEAELEKARRVLAEVQKKTRPEVIDRLKAAVAEKEALWQQTQDDLRRVEKLIEQKVRTEAELKRARLAEAAAKALLHRSKAELEEAEQGRTAEEIAVAQAEVTLREVAVEAAQRELAKTSMSAPFAGVVIGRSVEVGAYVRTGDPLVEIASIEDLDVFLELPERYVECVKVGTPLTLYADALPDWQLEAKVEAVVPAADPKSRNVPVRLRISNPDRRLFPGMFVRGKVAVSTRRDVLLAPIEAVTPRDDIQVAFVVEQGHARMVRLTLGLVGDGVAEVGDELKEGDTVVTVGGEALFPGAAVTVAPASGESTGPEGTQAP